ncbi:MAG: M48 family metalloprotease, partial [Deltaproteobacteria bacterium]
WLLLVFGLGAAALSFFAADRLMAHVSARLGFVAMSDIAGLPLLCLILMGTGLVLLPLQNGFARRLERRADAFALGATGRPDAFIAMMRRLGKKNLADFSPARWVVFFLYDHPPLAARIRMARRFSSPAAYEI